MNSWDATALRQWIKSGAELSKIWVAGFQAAQDGYVEDTNPYSCMSKGLVWIDGWSLYQTCPSFLEE